MHTPEPEPPFPPLPELVTPGEVAALFGVDAKTVTRWALSGRLPGVRTPSGHHRFRRHDIDRLLHQSGSTP
ncbi:DNA binding domain-containing protein, excisionase family [Nocardiopsis flavescens]|uniref:DNA binding domain-containing protein, excisionase family n=1 Tax=Nocardiopsis flavescens TaxID=758803 RepID=A0A1M6BA28_9ACTN|nr:BldC family transcriptional regulator [Nocardiopsis flavescens]SHI45591.1 DNA binding domain-containing protein, excisionase family [Nocardiopsis flavescens]